MRSVACLAIVLMHMMNVAEILYRNSISPSEDSVSMLIVYLCMWAVPLFVMVTGALLLDPAKSISIKTVYSRYIARILGALLLFGIIFRFVDMWMNAEGFSVQVILNGLLKIYTGTGWSHLWYLYMLIGIYALLPIYRKVSAGCDNKELLYLLGAFAVFTSLLPISGYFGVKSGFHLQTSAVYLLYFFAGYAIKSGILDIRKPLAWLLFVLSVAGVVILWYVRYHFEIAALDSMLSSYASPFVVTWSVSIFALMYRPADSAEPGLATKAVTFFDGTTFGIYLIHMIALRVLLRHMEINPYTSGIIAFIGVYLVSLVASFVIVTILHLIPEIKKLV